MPLCHQDTLAPSLHLRNTHHHNCLAADVIQGLSWDGQSLETDFEEKGGHCQGGTEIQETGLWPLPAGPSVTPWATFHEWDCPLQISTCNLALQE